MGLLEIIKNKALALRAQIRMWRLYDEAVKAMKAGEDLSRIAPDDLGCAESISRLIQRAAPELRFPTIISTRELYNYFTKSPSFKQVEKPMYGCIVLSVTGMGNGNIPNGHAGIVGKFTAYDSTPWIMSNDSYTGKFEANFTLGSWNRRYRDRGGMEVTFWTFN